MTQSSYLAVMLIMVARGAAYSAEVPDWVSFPGEEWEPITPEEAGLDVGKFNAWVSRQNPRFGKAYGG